MKRIWWFLRLVWRPVHGDIGDTWLMAWWKYRLSIKGAWEAAKAFEET